MKTTSKTIESAEQALPSDAFMNTITTTIMIKMTIPANPVPLNT